jgi:hypothetical protein
VSFLPKAAMEEQVIEEPQSAVAGPTLRSSLDNLLCSEGENCAQFSK